MIHVIFGMLALFIGLWAIAVNWYAFIDLFSIVGPLLLIFVGIIVLIAGISGRTAPEQEKQKNKKGGKDEREVQKEQ